VHDSFSHRNKTLTLPSTCLSSTPTRGATLSSASPCHRNHLFFSGCDILWAGVPLLTLPTSTMSGRVAASLLHAALQPSAAATLTARTLDGIAHLTTTSLHSFRNAPFNLPDYVDIAAQLLQVSATIIKATTTILLSPLLPPPHNHATPLSPSASPFPATAASAGEPTPICCFNSVITGFSTPYDLRFRWRAAGARHIFSTQRP
jgi:hypothetical protein